MSLTHPLSDPGSDPAPLWNDVQALVALVSVEGDFPSQPTPPRPLLLL